MSPVHGCAQLYMHLLNKQYYCIVYNTMYISALELLPQSGYVDTVYQRS